MPKLANHALAKKKHAQLPRQPPPPIPCSMPPCFSASVDLAFWYATRRSGAQPGECTLYDAHTRRAFGDVPANTHFAVVRVHVQHARLIARGAAHEHESPRVDIPLSYEAGDVHLSRKHVLLETLQLYFRGHSWHAPGCACAPVHAHERKPHVGTKHSTGGAACCALARACQFTSAEIARELGSADLGFKLGECTARAVLVDSGLFEEGADGWRCTFTVVDRASLLKFLLLNPTGVDAGDWFLQYPELRADVAHLRRDRMLYVLPNEHGADRLFPNSMKHVAVEHLCA